MSGKYQSRTAKDDRRYRSGWKRITAALSLLVVVSTISALVLPAVTMSRSDCALAEHQHTEQCYTPGEGKALVCTLETLGVHRHDEKCWDEKGQLTCKVTDFIVHTHEDGCYEGDVLTCTLPEVKAHQHGPLCYKIAAADPGHKHEDACYKWTPACTLEETAGHAHGEGCFALGGETLCTLEETAGHAHGEGCYAAGDEPLCAQEEAEGHAHEEGCFAAAGALLCAQPEAEGHTHGEGCFAAAGALLCTQPEAAAHTHTEACAVQTKGPLTCGQEEREPVAAGTVPELTCKDPVITLHTHDEGCYIAKEETDETTESWILELFRQYSEDSEEDRKVLICKEQEILSHQHSDSCFAEKGPALTCELPVHIHTIECRPVEEAPLTAEAVTELIGALPAMDVLEANLAIKSGEEKTAYMAQLTAQINEALEGYNGLSEADKALVTNYAKLADYAYLVTEDEAAKAVIGQIGDLPTLAEFEEQYAAQSSIQKPVYVQTLTAQAAQISGSYNALTAGQKALVLNYAKLLRLEARLNTMAVPEGALEFVTDDYTTTITVSDGANLPADTVMTARPLFDSNEDLVASPFSLFGLFSAEEEPEEPQDQDAGAYLEQIRKAVTWGEVTRVKLFNITLFSGGQEVQPAAPVRIRTEFAEPLYLEEGEVAYGVHIGDEGVDILPATTERDADGNITAITHSQSSFSPSGYILVHTPNPADIGPNILPVHYCLYVNGAWKVVGSTRTGWYGNYIDSCDWTPEKRDYITLDQVYSILGQYAPDMRNPDGTYNYDRIWETIWYQRAEDLTSPSGESSKTVRHDTYPEKRTITTNDGEEELDIFLLSGNAVKDDGYHIYFVPEGTTNADDTVRRPDDYTKHSKYADNTALADALQPRSKYYTMTVRDMNNLVYDLAEENDPTIFPQQQIIQYGEPVEVKVRPNNKRGTNMSWMWVNDQGHTVHGIDRLYDSNHNGIFEDQEADPRFHYTPASDATGGLEIYRFGLTQEEAERLNAMGPTGTENQGKTDWEATGILGRTTLIPFSRAVAGATPHTDRHVDIAVYLDGKWTLAGELSLMYQKPGVCVDTLENGTQVPRYFVTAGQLYSILKPYGFEDPVGENNLAKEGLTFMHAYGRFHEDENGVNPVLTAQLYTNGIVEEIVNPESDSKTIAVGISPRAELKEITLFYVPGGTTADAIEAAGVTNITQYTTSDQQLTVGDAFYSIKVRDDYQLVYHGTETNDFQVYIREGQPASVKVQNALSVLWSVREPWKSVAPAEPNRYVETKYTLSQDGNFNHYVFEAVNGPQVIEASSLNPRYIVQYFADVVTYQLYDSNVGKENTLAVINTSEGKGLPTNAQGTGVATKYLQLDLAYEKDAEGKTTTTPIIAQENNGTKGQKYEVHQEIVTQEFYREETYQYDKAHTWRNIDKLWDNVNYYVDRISILKDGMDPESKKKEDWWVYHCRQGEVVDAQGNKLNQPVNITFTNLADEEYAPRVEQEEGLTREEYGQPATDDYKILVTEGMIMRIHYALRSGSYSNSAEFFDYDITAEGYPDKGSGWPTWTRGINHSANMTGVNYDKTGTAGVYGFGNSNSGSGLSGAKYNGYYINKADANTYKGCSFGLVQKTLDTNGHLQWSSGIKAADIFGEKYIEDQKNAAGTQLMRGRTDYAARDQDNPNGGNLTFKRWGDVYVLSAANSGVSKKGQTGGSRGTLEYFFNPSPYAGEVHDHIFTNNFWVFDTTEDKDDPRWGEHNNTIYFDGYTGDPDNNTGTRDTADFPISDDGQEHNSFFGMKFTVGFGVTEDYLGPLSYVFFGDDDMWVYLLTLDDDSNITKSQLICDIGGVHSAVGEYVNLRDYIKEGTSGSYALRFYYTERGTSGSTCWMSFTLPSVTSITEEEGTSSIRIKKNLVNREDEVIDSDEEYEFTIKLFEDNSENAKELQTPISVQINRADGKKEYYATTSGRKLYLAANDEAIVRGAPIGSWYVIEETQDNRFDVVINGSSGYVIKDWVTEAVVNASFKNIYKGYELPKTGGGGSLVYMFSGIALMGTVLLIYEKQRRPIRKRVKRE